MFFHKKKSADELRGELAELESQSKVERDKYNKRRQHALLENAVVAKKKELRAQRFGNSALGQVVERVKPMAQKIAEKSAKTGGLMSKIRDAGDWAARVNNVKAPRLTPPGNPFGYGKKDPRLNPPW